MIRKLKGLEKVINMLSWHLLAGKLRPFFWLLESIYDIDVLVYFDRKTHFYNLLSQKILQYFKTNGKVGQDLAYHMESNFLSAGI